VQEVGDAPAQVCHFLLACALAAQQQGFAVDRAVEILRGAVGTHTGAGVSLTSPAFWSNVRNEVLPQLQRAKVALNWKSVLPPEKVLLGGAWVAALSLPCSNRGCANVTGSSEAQVKSRKCSGCGVTRYCSEACQTQHWSEHKVWCKKLKAQAAADASTA
jgi:MYND finger